jgi:hypothetical protein
MIPSRVFTFSQSSPEGSLVFKQPVPDVDPGPVVDPEPDPEDELPADDRGVRRRSAWLTT